MVADEDLKIVQDSECGCCRTESDEKFGCEEKQGVFTQRELDVLSRIRELNEKARTLKETLKTSQEEGLRKEASRDLERLRELRSHLEKERLAAEKERMRLLGHL